MQSTASNEFNATPPAHLLTQLEQMEDLPSPPDIVTRIIEALKDPEVDFHDLIKDLEKDPALSVKLMKTANSAMYARRREVTSLNQALLTMGQAAAATLALSFSLVSSLQERKGSGINLKYFWNRSLLTATTARALGKALGHEAREELFLAGLLQDIGLLVLDKLIPEHYMELGDNLYHHNLVCAHEIKELGVDHAWIGSWLLERWGLPEQICEAARYSHDHAPELGEGSLQQFVDCVSVASHISDVLLTDRRDEAICYVALLMQERLGLDEDSTLKILAEVSDQIPEIEGQFGMEIVRCEEVATILDQARKVLTDVSLNAQREIMQLNQQLDSLDTKAQSLEEKNFTDKLTGLRNREFMEAQIQEWVKRSRQFGFSVSLAFMDLDGFKAVNDTYSHSAGDEILRLTGKIISDQVRDSDIVARFGGDEFVLLFGAESEENARSVCERILNAYNNSTHMVDGQQVEVSISIGLATLELSGGISGSDLIDAADEALKHAKQRGKACVVSYADL